MSGRTPGKHGGETYPTICPRCYTKGELNIQERPRISTLRLKADGTIGSEDEAKEHGMEFELVCPKCDRKYWMDIEFIAGKAPSITVHAAPQMHMSENAKIVESVEVFYSREKRWWFSRKGGKEVEIGPGEPPG